MIAVTLTGVYLVYRHFHDRHHLEVEAARRVNGDVVILSYSAPFPDVDRVHDLARRTGHVARAGVFTIWPVEAQTTSTHAPALLKLQTLDQELTRRLRLPHDKVPGPRVEGHRAELAVGVLLAQRLSVNAGDLIAIRAKGAGTTGGATVHCRVATVIDWGQDDHNSQLVYADLSHLTQFALTPTGIELFVEPSELRRKVADTLEAGLDGRFVVMTLEDLLDDRSKH
jgi:ABC-type lipoprotein release transport system permease subunit